MIHEYKMKRIDYRPKAPDASAGVAGIEAEAIELDVEGVPDSGNCV
jgi:hypothetical protein